MVLNVCLWGRRVGILRIVRSKRRSGEDPHVHYLIRRIHSFSWRVEKDDLHRRHNLEYLRCSKVFQSPIETFVFHGCRTRQVCIIRLASGQTDGYEPGYEPLDFRTKQHSVRKRALSHQTNPLKDSVIDDREAFFLNPAEEKADIKPVQM